MLFIGNSNAGLVIKLALRRAPNSSALPTGEWQNRPPGSDRKGASKKA